MKSEKGQSLIEVIVVVTVGVLVVSALTFTTIFSLRNASFAKNSAQATQLAQEGIEWVRSGRDRDSNINNSSIIPGCSNVCSWDGDTDIPCDGIWSCRISNNGDCDNPFDDGQCYFTVDSSGVLTTVPTTAAEGIPAANPIFRRIVTLSDDADYETQKKVTVIVTWDDSSGPHESRLTTILRNLRKL